jgi:predicted glutamine amidotransferase
VCRLFGMSGGRAPVAATFWLLAAPDSIERQSHREPDGTGLGVFDADGRSHVHRSARPAFRDEEFGREARTVRSRTFVSHIRFASTGAVELRNTHPFEQDGRLLAHNGVLEDLDRLNAELGDMLALVRGGTDSERFFALVTREIRRAGGDVGAGLATAARWAADNLALFALNVVLTTPDGLWALRYPDTHRLLVLDRRPGGHRARQAFHGRSSGARFEAHSDELAERPAVVVASEPLDDDPGWRDLEPGELLHVGPELALTSTIALADPPRHRLTLDDLRPSAAASQTAHLKG